MKKETKIFDYLDELVKIFRLQNWEIKIYIKEDMNIEGETHLIYNDNKAIIEIKENSEEEMLKTLIHEIIHIIKRNSQEIATENIENENVRTIYTRYMEREQENLTNGIYELLTARKRV